MQATAQLPPASVACDRRPGPARRSARSGSDRSGNSTAGHRRGGGAALAPVATAAWPGPRAAGSGSSPARPGTRSRPDVTASCPWAALARAASGPRPHARAAKHAGRRLPLAHSRPGGRSDGPANRRGTRSDPPHLTRKFRKRAAAAGRREGAAVHATLADSAGPGRAFRMGRPVPAAPLRSSQPWAFPPASAVSDSHGSANRTDSESQSPHPIRVIARIRLRGFRSWPDAHDRLCTNTGFAGARAVGPSRSREGTYRDDRDGRP